MADLIIMENKFIDQTVFDNQVEDYRRTHRDPLSWSELPIGIIFKVLNVERQTFSWGGAHLVSAKDVYNNEIKVWGPRSMMMYIHENNKQGRCFYFQSAG